MMHEWNIQPKCPKCKVDLFFRALKYYSDNRLECPLCKIRFDTLIFIRKLIEEKLIKDDYTDIYNDIIEPKMDALRLRYTKNCENCKHLDKAEDSIFNPYCLMYKEERAEPCYVICDNWSPEK